MATEGLVAYRGPTSITALTRNDESEVTTNRDNKHVTENGTA
jgi:hypothetical protein